MGVCNSDPFQSVSRFNSSTTLLESKLQYIPRPRRDTSIHAHLPAS